MALQSRDPNFETKVRESFAKQTIMGLLGATLDSVLPGSVVVSLPFREDLCQQDGFFHAGVTATIADSAAGYAAYSLFEPGCEVLSTEFKVNLLAPAAGARLVAEAMVLKPGRTLTVVEADVFAEGGAKRTRCARFLGTMISLRR